jgi:iron complex outermembrane receptor protein
MKILLCVATIFCSATLFGQHSISFSIKNAGTGEPLAGASVLVVSSKKGASTDTSGFVEFKNLAAGKYTFRFSYTELEEKEIAIIIPYEGKQPYEIFLKQEEHEEEIIIQSTRSTRTIQNIPTRVEFIAGEELDEKANMKPGDIRMVLTESTGIQTQQTSATSANASIRIQGLDGRYTQILKDGLPLYAGFSGGLGLLQTPPLDLKQFEVIKGSASTLYGGGAIAGLVNLISKTPREKRELNFHLDATSGGGLNTSGFYGEKYGKTGVTLFASRNSNKAYDPADIGLTAIP